jgi:hypothetical protein
VLRLADPSGTPPQAAVPPLPGSTAVVMVLPLAELNRLKETAPSR